MVVVAGNIDREKKDIYHLNVSANDGRNTGYTSVTIHVTDINDHAPMFNITSITEVILATPENIPPGPLFVFTAIDEDLQGTNNSEIVYKIVNGEFILIWI